MSAPIRVDDALTVPPIGFGCMGFSQSYGVADDNQSKETLRRSVQIGCTLWNTARIYGQNEHNEKLVGQVLREGDFRSKVVVATKWGLKHTPNGLETDGSPEYCRQCIDESIENLGSAPDIYLLHRIDKEIPVEESVKAMEEARIAGKCKYIGLSAMSADTLRRAAAVAKIDFVEVEWSPFETTIESNGVIEACRELGVKILAYSPLGKGFLTGRFRSYEDITKEGDMRGAGAFPRFGKELFDHNFQLVKAIEKLAATKGCTPGQLALAWGCQVYPGTIIPIPGTKSVKYLEENWAATEVALTEDDLRQIRQVMKEIPVKGAQYSEQLLKLLDE